MSSMTVEIKEEELELPSMPDAIYMEINYEK